MSEGCQEVCDVGRMVGDRSGWLGLRRPSSRHIGDKHNFLTTPKHHHNAIHIPHHTTNHSTHCFNYIPCLMTRAGLLELITSLARDAHTAKLGCTDFNESLDCCDKWHRLRHDM